MTEDEMVGWHHQLNKKQTLALEILYGICIHKIYLIVSTVRETGGKGAGHSF